MMRASEETRSHAIVPPTPVIIECSSCHAKYQYAEERFEGKPSKKIRCARCKEIFEIHNPAPAAAAAEAGESTMTARPAPPPPEPAKEKEEEAPRAPAALPVLPSGKRLSLAILDGPDAGSVYRIEKPRITIGRSNADLTLNDTEASRQHASLEVYDTRYVLADLGSTNGTLCNGEKISGPVELIDKAEFQVGSTTLMLIVTDDH